MDPTEALLMCRRRAAEITALADALDSGAALPDFDRWHDAARDLAEAFTALDEWARQGGFPAWSPR